MADNPDKIQIITRSGYPRDVIQKLNEVIAFITRDTEYKFDTDSLNPIAKVKDTPDKRIVTLPRAPAGKIGKSDSPYTMGFNSTSTGHAAKNDSWTLKNGPSPPGGGPYTGVIYLGDRVFPDNAAATSRTFTDDLGAHVQILITPVYFYFRPMLYDTLGNIVSIGEEEGDLGGPSMSMVNFL